MNLLDPKEIKEEKKQNADQSQRLIIALGTEEARLNKELSLLRENAKVEKEKIEAETDTFVASQTLRRDTLAKEVEALEQRKAEALKPIETVRAEADTYLADAKVILARAEGKEVIEDERHEANMELAETLKDREDDLSQRETKVTTREEMVTVEESRVRDGIHKLSNDWVKFHETVNHQNLEFSRREKEIADRETVIDIRTERQNDRDKEMDTRKIRIDDEKATLKSAWDEFNSIKNKNI